MRGLCIATGQYDMEVGEQDREQVDKEKKVDARWRKEEDKHEETTNAQTRDIMDDMQME